MPELISSVAISAPVENVILELPSGYDGFSLRGFSIERSGGGGLYAQTSLDGETYAEDSTDYKTYNDIAGSAVGGDPGDMYAYLNMGGSQFPNELDIEIYPGGVNAACVLQVRSIERDNPSGMPTSTPIFFMTAWRRALGRQTYLKILSDEGVNLISGSFHLFGFPTPA